MMKLVLACAFGLLFAASVSAGERYHKPSYTNGYSNGHYKPKYHHKKPPKETARVAQPRADLPCVKAYVGGVNCFDLHAGSTGDNPISVREIARPEHVNMGRVVDSHF